MINISTQNPTSQMSIRNKSIDGFTFTPFLKAGVGGFNLGFEWVNSTAFQLKGVLRRGGQEITLFNETLKNLVLLSHLRNNVYYALDPFGNGFVYQNLASTEGILPMRFDFGGCLNLVGDDEFIISWQLNSGFFNPAVNIDTAQSYISLDETETDEIEYITPITYTQVIEANQTNPTYSLGDNVLNIILANYDKPSFLTSEKVVNSLKLTSDKLSKDDSYNEIVTKAISYYPTIAEAGNRYQNWIVYQGVEELDNVQLNLNLQTANVNASKNFVLVRRFITSSWLVTRATMIEANRNAKAEKKGSYNSSLVERDLF
jgi:hypothetical protein